MTLRTGNSNRNSLCLPAFDWRPTEVHDKYLIARSFAAGEKATVAAQTLFTGLDEQENRHGRLSVTLLGTVFIFTMSTRILPDFLTSPGQILDDLIVVVLLLVVLLLQIKNLGLTLLRIVVHILPLFLLLSWLSVRYLVDLQVSTALRSLLVVLSVLVFGLVFFRFPRQFLQMLSVVFLFFVVGSLVTLLFFDWNQRRPSGLTLNPNGLVDSVALLAPFALLVFRHHSSRIVLTIARLLLLLLLIGIPLLYLRSGSAGGLLLLPLAIIGVVLSAPIACRSRYIISALTVLAGIAYLAISNVGQKFRDEVGLAFGSGLELTGEGFSGRLAIWQAALPGIQERPIFGVGNRIVKVDLNDQVLLQSPHSVWIGALLVGGAVGLVLWLWTISAAIKRNWNLRSWQFLLIGVTVAVIGLKASVEIGALTMALLGTALIHGCRSTQRDRRSERIPLGGPSMHHRVQARPLIARSGKAPQL